MWMEFLAAYASSAYASTGVLEMFLLVALLLWYFNPRVWAAMDVISAHFFHKYTPEWGDSGRVTQSSALLRHKLTQGQHRAKERAARGRAEEAVLPAPLVAVKKEPWAALPRPDSRPLVGLSCANCTPTARKHENLENSGKVINVLNVKTLETPPTGFLSSIMPDILHCLSFKKFDYPYIYETVARDETLKDAIESAAQDLAKDLNIEDSRSFSTLLTKQRDRAMKILQNLRSTLSDVIIRLSAWVFLKTLPMMFSSMSCSVQQIEMLRRASDTGLPLLFLPLHRSHMDYIAVTLTLSINSIRSPLVASGENLNIPVFGWILRGLGAFFIKRRMDPVSGKKDKVYRALLHTYLTHCISAGHNFEFFIEGRRSRSGKPSMPKGGLLSIFVDAYLSGVLQDALLVPVSVNCERLVDDSFLRELTGAPKDPESFTSAMSAIWSALTTHYGQIRIDFNQPFSLNELVKSFQSKVKIGSNNGQTLHVAPSTASLYGTDIVVEEQRQLVDSIARHIIYDCCKSTAVMSTNAVAFLLLHEFRDGVMMDDLVNALDVLRGELRFSGKDTGFTGDSLDVINHALKLLGPGLVRREKRPEGDYLKPVTMLPNIIELNYYSNILLPHYALEGIVGTSLLALANESPDSKVQHDVLIDTCLSLCQILQFEFLFTKTCQSINDALFETVDSMATNEIITLLETPSRPRFDDRHFDISEDDYYEEGDELAKIPCAIYKVNKSNSRLVTYGKLVRSLIDTYYVTAYCLNTLVKTPSTEREFVKYVLAQIRSRVENNILTYGESVSTETITNCVRLFEKISVIDGYYQDGVKLLSLAQGYDNEELLEPVIHRIHRFQI